MTNQSYILQGGADPTIIDEFTAGADGLQPGDFVQLGTNGQWTAPGNEDDILQLAGVVQPDVFAGRTSYDNGSKIRVWVPEPGDVGLVNINANANLGVGTPLETAGSGNLKGAANGSVSGTTVAQLAEPHASGARPTARRVYFVDRS